MPTGVQRLFVVVLSFLVGCACTYIIMVPSSRDKTISSSPPTSIADAVPTGVVAVPVPLGPDTSARPPPLPPPPSVRDPPPPPPPPLVSRLSGDPFKEMECAVSRSWSCLGVPFHKECGIVLGYHSGSERSTAFLLEQVVSIRKMPYFNTIRIGLVTDLETVPDALASAFSPIVKDSALPSAAPYEVLDRSPFQRSMYFNRSTRVWVRIVAPIHFAMDLLQSHDVLMAAKPMWDAGEAFREEMKYQTGVVMARTDSKCVKHFLGMWRSLAGKMAASPAPWVGADDMVSLPDAIRASYVRLMALPPEMCVNDVVGKDECIDWKRRWKGTNARCDVYTTPK